MTGPDPVDVRLLSAVAEMGRVAIPDLASRLGMDVREVAARLAALSTTGLPMIVGVECDPQGIRNAVASAQQWVAQHSGPHATPPAPQHTGSHPAPADGHQPPQRVPQPMTSWGPPGTAAWVRADQPPAPPQPGEIGGELDITGPAG